MTTAQPLHVRARMLPVQRLRIESLDKADLNARLSATLTQAPALFQRAPVALDLSNVVEQLDETALSMLLTETRERGLVVFALAGPKAALLPWCDHYNLAWQDEQDKPAKTRSATPALTTQVITQPVRSGQQIYARDAHLLVMSQVSAGAEVIADGNIHIFGALRGRALAGVQGLTSAEIVCQHLDADLVAIAGVYRVRDDLPESGSAARIYRLDDELRVDSY
ncbi:septum site-determining protein MinC [Saccharospirillum sp. MSK14-1]|uniref:septum site-determining protein MinC n=1 Tax=Saccharospirillum sp. MSK14-1 TaxID=1897632 RepID=UPI000D396251|nr:septum site-determining protein MinC [Saccharospirillum sp. MSK14-1]PTY38957.1 septum site-determining protein MinC [Saccharospirillum sp. MSK14-1]